MCIKLKRNGTLSIVSENSFEQGEKACSISPGFYMLSKIHKNKSQKYF